MSVVVVALESGPAFLFHVTLVARRDNPHSLLSLTGTMVSVFQTILQRL